MESNNDSFDHSDWFESFAWLSREVAIKRANYRDDHDTAVRRVYNMLASGDYSDILSESQSQAVLRLFSTANYPGIQFLDPAD